MTWNHAETVAHAMLGDTCPCRDKEAPMTRAILSLNVTNGEAIEPWADFTEQPDGTWADNGGHPVGVDGVPVRNLTELLKFLATEIPRAKADTTF